MTAAVTKMQRAKERKSAARGSAARGIEILRCGARTPTVRLRGQGEECGPRFVLCPRRRTVGASPYSVGFQSHALHSHTLRSYAFLVCTLLACVLSLSLPAGVSAAPKKNAPKDTVQVQTTLSGAGSGLEETNLGDLVADAVRQTGGAQVALVPADEIDGGASIPAGKTDASKIVSALRYADDPSDTVVVLTLTGAQLLRVAERSVSRAPTPFEGFLQVSGLQIRYSASQPEGKRVSLVGVGGSEINAGQSYQVATTRALAGGSLGYFQILPGKSAVSDTGTTLAKSLSSFLSAHSTITNAVEGRITQ